jgi:hypothetical protein
MTSEAPSPVNPRPSNHTRLCLKMLTPRISEVMRDLVTTTSEDIASTIITKYFRLNPNVTGQDPICRRIYDVINVLSAAGVIDKVGKQVV